MADEADQAALHIEATEALALEEIRNRKPEAPVTGYCLFCGEDVSEGRRWCDAEHRDLWEQAKRFKR